MIKCIKHKGNNIFSSMCSCLCVLAHLTKYTKHTIHMNTLKHIHMLAFEYEKQLFIDAFFLFKYRKNYTYFSLLMLIQLDFSQYSQQHRILMDKYEHYFNNKRVFLSVSVVEYRCLLTVQHMEIVAINERSVACCGVGPLNIGDRFYVIKRIIHMFKCLLNDM